MPQKLLIFTKDNKLDRTNQIVFKNLIIMTAKVQDIISYLDRFIKNPTTLIKSTSYITSKLSKDSTTTKPKPIVVKTIFAYL